MILRKKIIQSFYSGVDINNLYGYDNVAYFRICLISIWFLKIKLIIIIFLFTSIYVLLSHNATNVFRNQVKF